MNIIKCTSDDLEMLYWDSAWTWEGMSTDEDNLAAISTWFAENGCPLKKDEFYLVSGKQMNEFCGGLTGNNAYPEDLNILSILLDNITNVETLFMKKFEVGARWFDDIYESNKINEED